MKRKDELAKPKLKSARWLCLSVHFRAARATFEIKSRLAKLLAGFSQADQVPVEDDGTAV